MISLWDIRKGVNRFFYDPISPVSLGAFRAAIGFLVVLNAAFLIPDLQLWFGPDSVVSMVSQRQLLGMEHFSLLWHLPPTLAMAALVLGIHMLAAACLSLGVLPRFAAFVAFVTLVSLHHRNHLIFHSGDVLLRLFLFFLIFAPSGAAFSLATWLRRGKGGPRRRITIVPWAQRMIQLQVALVYFVTFCCKIQGDAWLNGNALYYASRLEDYYRFSVPILFDHMWTIRWVTWLTLLVELSLCTLVWIRELRLYVLAAGVALHLGIEYSMNIPFFEWTLIAPYVLFLDENDMRVLKGWLAKMRRIQVRTAAFSRQWLLMTAPRSGGRHVNATESRANISPRKHPGSCWVAAPESAPKSVAGPMAAPESAADAVPAPTAPVIQRAEIHIELANGANTFASGTCQALAIRLRKADMDLPFITDGVTKIQVVISGPADGELYGDSDCTLTRDFVIVAKGASSAADGALFVKATTTGMVTLSSSIPDEPSLVVPRPPVNFTAN